MLAKKCHISLILCVLGVPACRAAQSACYGLRYRFGAVRTMRASTHALRMPNACAQRVYTRVHPREG